MRAGGVVRRNPVLENQLQRELPLPAVVSVLDLAEIGGADVCADASSIRIAFELRVVESVESLGSELHVESLGESEIFQ